MQQFDHNILGRVALLACLAFLLSLSHSYFISDKSSAEESTHHLPGAFGSEANTSPGFLWAPWFNDPKTVSRRLDAHLEGPISISYQPDDTRFVVPEANLAATKYLKPTVIRSRPTYVTHITYGYSCPSNTEGNCNGLCDCRWSWPSNELGQAPWQSPEAKCRCKNALAAHNGMVVDVLSIGSKNKPELLTAQMETWASHYSVRNFWGVTDQQDYDVNCDQQSWEALETYKGSCRDWNGKKFAHKSFAQGRYDKKGWGWFCAQRRPGHALGWLQSMYQDPAKIPDILILVDDDTSVDIEELQRQMSTVGDSPYVANPCKGRIVGGLSKTGVGGVGTFFNRAAIERLSQPIFCDDQKQESMNSACENLQANRVGEYDVFQQGDSAFDIFYKYSALRDFCMHSDWLIGYMINGYSGTSLQLIHQCQGSGINRFGPPCNRGSISCHYQNPEAMKHFAHDRVIMPSHPSWNTLRMLHLRQPWGQV